MTRYGDLRRDPPPKTWRRADHPHDDPDWHRPTCALCGSVMFGARCWTCEPEEPEESLTDYILRRWREGEYADG